MTSSDEGPPTVLVTRPAEDAAELSGLLEAAGFQVMAEPLLSIAPTPPTHAQLARDLDGVQALLFTSANGVRAFARESRLRDLPALCVGPATASTARMVGFSTVEQADGDVAALTRLVEGRFKPADGRLYHIAGSHLAGDLAGRLADVGFEVVKRAFYKAETASAFSPAARTAMAEGRIQAVVLFSPRTAETFARLAAEAGLSEAAKGMTAACLSQAVADRAAALAWGRVLIAPAPEAAEIASLLRTAEPVRVQAAETPPDSPEKADKIAEGQEAEGEPIMAEPNKPDAATDSPDAKPTAAEPTAAEPTAAEPTAEETAAEETAAEETAAVAEHPTPDAEAVIDAFGGIRPMATTLGVAVSTVQGWKSRNHIPDNRWRDVIAAADAAGIDLAATLTGPTGEASPEPDGAEGPETDGPAAEPGAESEETAEDLQAEPDSRPEPETETAEPAEPERPAPEPSEPAAAAAPPRSEPARAGAGPARAAFLLAAVALIGLALEPYWRPAADRALDPLLGQYLPAPAAGPGVDAGEIEALARDVEALGGRVETLAGRVGEALSAARADAAAGDPAAIEDLRARLATLEEAVQSAPAPVAPDGAPASPDPAALQAAVQDAAQDAAQDAVRAATETLTARVAALESALDSRAEAESVAALRDRAAALESRVETQDARIAEIARAPALKGAEEAATVIAVGAVQDALAAGRPFAAPLDRVAALAPEDPALADAVARLRPAAERGVATLPALQRRFAASAAAMHAAVAPDADWVGETIARLSALVSVRQTGEAAERPPVSRAEAALARGDLAGAVAALSEIREASAEAARWLEDAERRLAAEAALSDLRDAATARLSPAAGGGAGGPAGAGETGATEG